ncbi:hypothetical protein ES332_D05G243600v1 [Gossypium tomentosum]|uniref:Anaphase-promoting complex subunit 4 WD40 domain-containing protein n=1 Tax=Gossypium tomentosum TaxID=34277 RepID=A0A5D2L2M8_GOSTO|nr:hypothetical protein ES332_D05G243600v1 [Gossypium tomentosum]TYH72283.1 hypothetical protein ES332_D05G243600v1 [Gossypium tomentosum]
MEQWPFHDGNVHNLLDNRRIDFGHDVGHSLQMHSSLIRRLSMEQELEGHQGCVNAVAWNSNGSLLISGSDDALINIWSYSGRKLLHSIETGHSANIFCTKFIPESSDELVASGAGDAEVRLFNLSRLNGRGFNDGAITPSALYQCHTRRVKKLAFEVGNPNMVWSASEDGTLRQHDFREGTSCPPAGSSHQECRNVLLDLRYGAKRSLADPPRLTLALKSCDISSTRPHLLLVGGNDAFARLYDRRMLPPLTSCRKRMLPPTCVNYFCPMHLSDRGRSSLHLTHVTFSPNGEEVLLSYSGEHVYLMDVNHAEAEKSNKASDGSHKGEPRTGRVLSLSDILYRSEANSDALQDGPRSEREDSDFDEELELDFETLISGDEGRDVESNIFHGSLNLRIHRRGDSTRETGACGSPSSSSQNGVAYQPEAVIDMKRRYAGHCNVGTDIKQASFLGQRGEFVASGSDDGRWFIWEKQTGKLIKMLLGDGVVVNCVQSHPFDCFVATSGIDNTIKLWTPSAAVPSMAAGGSAGPEAANVLEAMESNQQKLCCNREAFLPFELLERFRMHDFSEGSLQPFECAQT